MADREKDLLAAEYALGSLDAAERAQAEEQAKTDAGFAAEVGEWEQRLSPLAEAVEPADPPASLWKRIEAALGAIAGPSSQWPDDVRSMIEDLQNSLAAWRMAAVGAAAAAAAIALAWFGGVDMPFRQVEPPSKYVAMLQGDGGKTGFVVTFDMANKTCAIRTVLPDLPEAKALELWAIMKDKKTPMSLGLVGTSAYAMVEMPDILNTEVMKDGVQLAISLEPPGGAPTGQPMGPVVYAGDLIKLTP